jgi:hypothetical protein
MGSRLATWLAKRLPNRLKISSTGRHYACYTVGMRFGWRSILFAVAAVVALGCTSPTLPLPPPSAPSETAGTEPGTYVLTGSGAVPGAFLFVYDASAPTDQIVGTVVAKDGTWTVTVTATKGDVVQIWQETGGSDSTAINFTI